MLWGVPVFFACLASSAYWLAFAISLLNSLQVKALSLGPITFTMVGLAQEEI